MMIALVLIGLCTVATLVSIVAVVRVTSRRRGQTGTTLPVSVLKPLCGADDGLEGNLETFFTQRYPDFELVFGVADPRDPAIGVVERLRARHPQVRARIVVHQAPGLNPKIANLRGMVGAGAHDLVVISDSNIAVNADYVERMVGCFQEPGTGLVTSLIAGVGERTLGSTLENLHLVGPIAGGVAASEFGGNAVVIGKSMMFRRSVFESLGGLESVASILAEDYVMGRMFTEAGHRVRLCPDVIRNVSVHATAKTFLKRQLRWGLLRSRLKPLVYPLEPLLNPMAVALLALVLGAGGWTLAWGVGLTLLRDVVQWWMLRGPAGLLAAAPLGAVKELLAIGVWAVAPFVRSVSWRGHRLRVSAGTRLYARV
jgi:ceramide glucosyltransferase